MSGIIYLTPQAAFGRVLRNRRLAVGLSQEQLGLESGVQRNFISLMETGQNQPTISTLFKLANALKIHPSDLVFETQELVDGKSAASTSVTSGQKPGH